MTHSLPTRIASTLGFLAVWQIGAMLANITLNAISIQFIGDPASLSRGAFGGLALANSVTTLIEALILWLLLRRRLQWSDVSEISSTTLRMAVATALMAVVILVALPLTNAFGSLVQLILIGIVGGGVYFGSAILLKLDEARAVPQMVLRRVRR